MNRIFYSTVAIGLALGLAQTASAQGYQFTKVLDAATQRPDGNGLFAINTITTPAYDGQWIVFRDNGNKDDMSLQAIWSFNTADRTFHKLVDLHTVMPGGTATFTDIHLLDSAPTLRNGTVLFLGRNTATGSLLEGLYSVPVGGGAISVVADYRTANPSGGTFSLFDSAGKPSGAFSFDGSTVAFSGQGSAQTLGIYTAKPNGASMSMVADNLHPFTAGSARVLQFSTPAIAGSNVVMIGTDTTDPAKGYNGLYLGRVGGNGSLIELANSNQQLPSNANSAFHTRFDAPVLAVDGAQAFFHAGDANTAGSFGLYTVDLSTHAMSRIADNTSTLTGLGKLAALAGGSVAANQGALAFKASDAVGANALYLWQGGATSRVIGSGDALGTLTVKNVIDPGPGAMKDLGIAFVVDVGVLAGPSLYLATPAPKAMNFSTIANSASYGASSIAPGEIFTLYGSGLGPATLATYTWDANNRIPTQLAGVRVLFNGTASPILYASDRTVAGVVPFTLTSGSTAKIQVEYSGALSPALNVAVTSTLPGLFSVDYSGSGPGAILNGDNSYNSASNPAAAGSIVVLWLSGLGPISPTPTDGSVVAGTTTLQFPITVSIGGAPAQILYQGQAPQALAGLYQVNCVIPAGTASGQAQIAITSDGRPSQPNLTVFVK